MSKIKRERNRKTPNIITLGLGANEPQPVGLIEEKQKSAFGFLKSHLWLVGLIGLLSLAAFGAALTYFGKIGNTANSKDRSLLSRMNLFAPPPSPTPQLSKEYVYAGSRLLAVEDVNAHAAPLVSVSGTVTGGGRGLRNVTVSMIDPQNVTTTAVTDAFGQYQFSNVQSFVTYTFGASSRGYRFLSQQLNVTAALTNTNFVGEE